MSTYYVVASALNIECISAQLTWPTISRRGLLCQIKEYKKRRGTFSLCIYQGMHFSLLFRVEREKVVVHCHFSPYVLSGEYAHIPNGALLPAQCRTLSCALCQGTGRHLRRGLCFPQTPLGYESRGNRADSGSPRDEQHPRKEARVTFKKKHTPLLILDVVHWLQRASSRASSWAA